MLAVEAIGRSVPENGLYAAIRSQAREIVIKSRPMQRLPQFDNNRNTDHVKSFFSPRRQVRIDTAESQ